MNTDYQNAAYQQGGYAPYNPNPGQPMAQTPIGNNNYQPPMQYQPAGYANYIPKPGEPTMQPPIVNTYDPGVDVAQTQNKIEQLQQKIEEVLLSPLLLKIISEVKHFILQVFSLPS